MSPCNNTTYYQMILESKELQMDLFKYSFFIKMVEFNAPTAMMINKTVTPIWIIIGIFGNIISALVWASPRMRTCPTIAYYLTCLSLADLTFLIIQIFWELEGPWLIGVLDVHGWCQIFSVINISVQYFCVFLIFAFTVERFLSICYPFKSERFGKTRTPRIIMYLLLLCIILGVPQAYFWDINQVGECQVRSEVNTKTTVSFYSIYNWSTELAIFGVLPIFVLFLNIAVVMKIDKIGKIDIGNVKIGTKSGEKLMNNVHDDTAQMTEVLGSRKCSLSKNDSELLANRSSLVLMRPSNVSTASAHATHRSTTITLLCVSFFHIFTMLPNTIVYALQHRVRYGPMPCRIEDMGGDPLWSDYFTFQTIKFIIKEISLSHHVANVFIYMATSGRFVTQVLALFHLRTNSCDRQPPCCNSPTTKGVSNHYRGNGKPM